MRAISPRAWRYIKRMAAALAGVGVILTLLVGGLSITSVDAQVLTKSSLSLAIVSIILAILSYTRPQRWYPDDVRYYIQNSEPSDWEYQELSFERGNKHIYKQNRELVLQFVDPYNTDETFDEDWVKRYSNNIARKQVLEVSFAGQRYDTITIVHVDEGKKPIPLPSYPDHTISAYERKIGEIIHCSKAPGIRPDVPELKREYEQALSTGCVTIESQFSST